jgi:hypothetical protein
MMSDFFALILSLIMPPTCEEIMKSWGKGGEIPAAEEIARQPQSH